MNRMELKKIEHSVKIGDECPMLQPNITEDSIFYDNGEVIGFYMNQLPKLMQKYITIANAELLSVRVPKQEMSRGPQGSKKDKLKRARDGVTLVTQYSTILGSVPPKPHMRRNYPTRSSVHSVTTARHFIKSMFLACLEAEKLINKIAPDVYQKQKQTVEENVPDYGATFDSCDNSILVYPAWRNTHGVTPIIPLKTKGYRNSMVFYALKAFKNYE
jgi:hypothetical protein